MLATGTVSASGSWGCGILSDTIPSYLYAVVTNSDSTNAATVTVLVESFT